MKISQKHEVSSKRFRRSRYRLPSHVPSRLNLTCFIPYKKQSRGAGPQTSFRRKSNHVNSSTNFYRSGLYSRRNHALYFSKSVVWYPRLQSPIRNLQNFTICFVTYVWTRNLSLNMYRATQHFENFGVLSSSLPSPLKISYALLTRIGSIPRGCTKKWHSSMNVIGGRVSVHATNYDFTSTKRQLEYRSTTNISHWYALRGRLTKNRRLRVNDTILGAGSKKFVLSNHIFYPSVENSKTFRNLTVFARNSRGCDAMPESRFVTVSPIFGSLYNNFFDVGRVLKSRAFRGFLKKYSLILGFRAGGYKSLVGQTKFILLMLRGLRARVGRGFPFRRKSRRTRRHLVMLKRAFTKLIRRLFWISRRKTRLKKFRQVKINRRLLFKLRKRYYTYLELFRLRINHPLLAIKSMNSVMQPSWVGDYTSSLYKPNSFHFSLIFSSAILNTVLVNFNKTMLVHYFFLNPVFLKVFMYKHNPLCKSFHRSLALSYSIYSSITSLFPSHASPTVTNLSPHHLFRRIVVKKILTTKVSSYVSYDILPWVYLALTRFMENCSGKKVLLQFYSHITQNVSSEFQVLYARWLPRFKYYEQRLGHRFFLGEALNIIHLSFFFTRSEVVLLVIKSYYKTN